MKPNNILIVNTYGIGDVVLTTPLVRNLRLAFPQARLTYMANGRGQVVLKANGDIHEIIVYERDAWVALYRRNIVSFIRAWFRWIAQLRAQHYDMVFDFSLNSSFGVLWVLAGIPRRIGFDFKGRGRWLNHTLPLEGFHAKHVADYYLDVLALVDVPVKERRLFFPLDPAAQQWACDWVQQQGFKPSQKIYALVVGGGQSWGKAAGQKRWPPAHFADLADKIVEQLNGIVILFGNPEEKDLAHEVRRVAKSPCVDMVGATTIDQMAALFKHCDVVIANDGGPLHVAVSSGAKTVSIFGPVDPCVYGPYPPTGHETVTAHLACQPCYRKFRMSDCGHLSCLKDLSVDHVLSAVKRLTA